MPGWPVVRGQTNTVSWSSRLGVGSSMATRSLKHLSRPRCLVDRLFSQRLWLRTLIVLLSRSGHPGSIPAHTQTMNITNNKNLMPHRPSRVVTTRVALLAAARRAGKRKQAIAEPSLLGLYHIRSSILPPLIITLLQFDSTKDATLVLLSMMMMVLIYYRFDQGSKFDVIHRLLHPQATRQQSSWLFSTSLL